MLIFSSKAKSIYKKLRVFEFNTGESATDVLNDLPLDDFIAWAEDKLPIKVERSMDIIDLVDDIFADKLTQCLTLNDDIKEYASLALLSIYLEENIGKYNFLLEVIPPKQEVEDIIQKEIALLEAVFNQIQAYCENIFTFK